MWGDNLQERGRRGWGGRDRKRRDAIRIRNMTRRRSVADADRICGTRMQLGHESPSVGFKKGG